MDEALNALEEQIMKHRASCPEDQRPIWATFTVMLVMLRALSTATAKAPAKRLFGR